MDLELSRLIAQAQRSGRQKELALELLDHLDLDVLLTELMRHRYGDDALVRLSLFFRRGELTEKDVIVYRRDGEA